MAASSGILKAAAIGLLALAASGCSMVSSVISTGARSAIIVVTNEDGSAAPAPPRDEVKSLLAQLFLWLADDKRAAQWIAFVAVHPTTSPFQPVELTFVGMEKNPTWRPLEVSSPIGNITEGAFRDMNAGLSSQRSGRPR